MKTLTNRAQGRPVSFRYYCDDVQLEHFRFSGQPNPEEFHFLAVPTNMLSAMVVSFLICIVTSKAKLLGQFRVLVVLLLFSSWAVYNYLLFLNANELSDLYSVTSPMNGPIGALLIIGVVGCGFEYFHWLTAMRSPDDNSLETAEQ